MSDYTSDESEKIYNLIDQLPTQYFGGDGSEWEDAVLRLAAIVTAKRQRMCLPNVLSADDILYAIESARSHINDLHHR